MQRPGGYGKGLESGDCKLCRMLQQGGAGQGQGTEWLTGQVWVIKGLGSHRKEVGLCPENTGSPHF